MSKENKSSGETGEHSPVAAAATGSEVNVKYTVERLRPADDWYKNPRWDSVWISPNEASAIEDCNKYAAKHPGEKWRVTKRTETVIKECVYPQSGKLAPVAGSAEKSAKQI